MSNFLKFNLIFLLVFTVWYADGQVRLRVRIDAGNATCSNCCDQGIFGGCNGSDPRWRVNVANQGWTTYPMSGLCFTNAPNTQYDELFNCPGAYPANIQVCLRTFDDDGALCIVNEDCAQTNCQNYPVPAPGGSATYTININQGGSCGGSVTFTLFATGSFPGLGNDQICNAINLGTLTSNSTIGNNGLSNYNNFCAGNAGDPNPWGGNNDQGVWFQFTTGPFPAAVIELQANSDPQNLGNGIDLQLALYASSNGSCTGALSLVKDEYEGLGLLNDEDMSVNCLAPNTTYFILVDGEYTFLINNGGQEGFFGLQVQDNGVLQAGDEICDAENLGTVPAGGAVATPNLSRSNVCATNINDPNPGSWTSDQTVWFMFQAPPSGHVFIDADSDQPWPFGTDAIDLQLAVYETSTGNCTGTINNIASDYDPITDLFNETLEVKCLTPGQNYWVMVDGSALNVSGIFDITITDGGIPPAPNDLICDAIPLGNPGSGGTVGLNDQNNYCADNILEPIPANWGNDQGVWYTFIAPPSGKVMINLDNGGLFSSDNIDLQVAVYDLSGMVCTGVPTEIQSEHDGIGIVWDEDMEVDCLIPGREYWILVDGEGSILDPDLQEGIFDISVYGDPQDPPSPYDDPCNAFALGDPTGGAVGTTPGTVHGSQNNFCATANGEPQPSGFTANQTVWYTFVAPSTGNVNIQITSDAIFGGTDPIDLQIAVWETPGCAGPWREHVSGDDLLYDVDLDVFCLTVGETYYIQIDGQTIPLIEDGEGYFDITITEIPPIPVAPNDSICNAIALGNPFTGTLTAINQQNLCADDQGDPNPSAFDTDQTVWYSFTTPPTGGPYAVNINCTSSLPWPFGNQDAIDLQVAVFESSNNLCTGVLTEVESSYSFLDLFNENVNVPCLLPGMTYFVMVDGSFLDVQGYFDISISAAASVPIPTNDLICQHEDLGTVPVGGSINNGVNYFNFCADVEPGEPSPFGIEQTVWFSFIAPNHPGINATSNVTVSVESDPAGVGDAVDLQLAIYESSNNLCTGSLSLLENGSDDPLFSFDASVSVTCLYPGRRYWVQVDGTILNQEGYFQIEINDDGSGYRPPYNILCNAVSLGQVPNGGSINNNVDYTNLCSDTEPGEPVPSAFSIDKTVWFTFEAPSSGNVTINAFNDPNNIGDEIDLQLALYYSTNNTCAGPFLEVDSDHDIFNKDESLSVDCLEPGRTYFLQVDGSNGLFGDEDGWFTLEIVDDGGSSNFPYNNNICDAYNFGIPAATFTLSNESNVCANVELNEPGIGSYATHTVWYQFTAPPSGRVEIDVVSTNIFLGMDPEVRVFSSSNNACTGNLSQIEVSNWPTALISENIEATCLIPGNTYFIQVDGSGLVIEGTFDITIRDIMPTYGTGALNDPEPINNYCDSAITLSVQAESCLNGSGTFSQLNYGQPTITYDPAFAQNCGDNCGDTWYQFTMPASGNAVVEGNDDNIGGGIFGDFSDLTVVAYSGTCNNLNPIDCGQGGFFDDVSFQIAAAPGTVIWLQVFNEDGDDNGEDYELCISEGCGFDDCLDAIAIPMIANVPYCFNTAGASGENVSGGAPGYYECSEGDNPENSIYYYFVSDCNGSDVTLSVINAISNGTCILGITPTDGFNISLFEDDSPCDNNPDNLVDCQSFTSCEVQPINWSYNYTGLQPNTTYIIQIDGGFASLGGDNYGEIMITTTTNPVTTPIATPVTCSGLNDGTAAAQTLGGVGPFTFQWSNGETDSLITNLAAGNYFVTVTGDNGCFDTAFTTVLDGSFMSAVLINTQDVSCTGDCNGQATVIGIGGNVATNYTYLWDGNANNQSTATATGLCIGNYSVTVYDDNNCFDTVNVVISTPSPMNLQLQATTQASCNGICDGSASVSASGGTVVGNYSFIWSDGQILSSATGLCAGFYQVSVYDDNLCLDSLTVEITQPTSVTDTLVNISHVTCAGDSNGSFELLTTNGSPPYVYSLYDINGLINISTSSVFNNLAAGNYGVLVSDVNGCKDSVAVQILEPIALDAQLISSIDPSCNGYSDGEILVQAIIGSGTAPYAYSLDGINFQSSGLFENLNAGNYNITIRDSHLCDTVLLVSLIEPLAINIQLNNQSIASCGLCDASADISVSGGQPPFLYIWSNGETTEDAASLCSGSNSLTVSDDNNCTTTFLVNIANSNSFSVTPTITQEITCNGSCDASILINTSATGSPHSFIWDNGQSTSSISALCAGWYTVTVTDITGCFVVENIQINEPDELSVLLANLNSISCFDGSDGQAIATPSGGTASFNYLWDNGETTQSAIALDAGMHSLTITDANNCSLIDSILVQEPLMLNVNILSTVSSSCASSGCDGSASISVSGGTAPYAYSWSNGNSTAAPTDLCPNFNEITVTDALGCTATDNVLIPANTNLDLTLISMNEPECYGDCNGSLIVSASGGNTTAGYLFSWDDPSGQSNALATGLCAGIYHVTVEDIDGCSDAIEITLPEPAPLNLTAALLDPNCNGSSDGSIILNVSGGTPNYSYNWSNNNNINSNTNLFEGNYSVTVVDANNCTIDTNFSLVAPPPLLSTIKVDTLYNGQVISCANGNDGIASISVNGGVPGYSYLWINGETTDTITGLQASTYPVTITDANGCNVLDSVSLMHPPQIIPIINILSNYNGYNVSCPNSFDGSATVNVSGGTGAYDYLWSDGQVTQTATGLNNGTYALTVSDINGCWTMTTDSLTAPPPLEDSIVLINSPSCFGYNDASATVLINGGVPAYQFIWDNGETTQTAQFLDHGYHSVSITDGNNCSLVSTVAIIEPEILTANSSSTSANCFGSSTGSISINIQGGIPPYSYIWSNGSTTANLINVVSGNYTLSITDANDCSLSLSDSIGQPAAFSSSISILSDYNGQAISCSGSNDASLEVIAAGGTGLLTYLWSNGQNGPILTGIGAGLYQVTITDVNNCIHVDSISITAPTPLSVNGNILSSYNGYEVSCFGASDGIAELLASGGTGAYNYQWSSGESTQTASALSAGSNGYTVTDANGCSTSGFIVLDQPELLELNPTVLNQTTCFGYNDGQASIQVNGGVAAYQYFWSDGFTDSLNSNLSQGQYFITVSDQNGCQSSTALIIYDPLPIYMINAVVTPASCSDGNDASVSINVAGGTGLLSYLWSNGQSTSTLSTVSAGSYQVTVTDTNGCTAIFDFNPSQQDNMQVLFTNINDIDCNNNQTGSATAMVGGGSIPYQYSWNNGAYSNSNIGLNLYQGWNILRVIDANGCTLTDSVFINNPNPLEVSYSSTDISCHGDNDGSISLNVSGGTLPYQYAWSPSVSLLAEATGLYAGQYTISISDANNCVIEQTITLQEPDPLLLTFIEVMNVDCDNGTNGSLQALASQGSPLYDFYWNTGWNESQVSTSSISGLSAGSYSLSVSDQNNCTSSIDTFITDPAELIAIATGDSVECFGDQNGSISIVANGGTAPYFYTINGITQSNPIFNNLLAGNYDVNVSDVNGCQFNTTATIYQPDSVVLEVPDAFSIDYGQTAQLWVFMPIFTPTNPVYNWSPPQSLNCSNCPNPLAQPSETTLYTISVSGDEGCVSSSNILVEVSDDKGVYVPNGFSPNGDNNNDVFMLYSSGSVDRIEEFMIFDRWGELVCYHKDVIPNFPAFGWDGTFNGEEMNTGIFVYMIRVRYFDGSTEIYKGDLTLIR